MSEKAEIDSYTAWANVHLAAAECQLADVVMDLLQGLRLRVLLQSKLLCLILDIKMCCLTSLYRCNRFSTKASGKS